MRHVIKLVQRTLVQALPKELTAAYGAYRLHGLAYRVGVGVFRQDKWEDAVLNLIPLQKQRYKELIVASKQAGIAQFHFWGVADNQDAGWRKGEYPLIFDRDFEKKPAYFGVLEGLKG